MTGTISILAALGLTAWLFHPRMLRSDGWRAISTPLASIIGSGFLVSVPILRDLYGAWAVFAMTGLLALAYLVGGAVRENIVHVEPLLANHGAGRPIASLERLSQLVLAFAYFVSVAYYLVLFASFLLKPLGVDDGVGVKVVVTALLAAIGVVGLWRGFRAVEGLEVYAVSAKLAVIGGLMAGLALFVGRACLATPAGLVLLPGHFDLAFFVFMTPLLGNGTPDRGVAAIVDMLRPVSVVLPLLVLIGALASQSSAAIADTLGAGGLIHDICGTRISLSHTYPLIALVAAVVTWETNVYSLIAFASRCFALYYALQCVVAALSASRRARAGRAGWFATIALICAAIVVFGTPAEGE
jgi:hypothetical protein